MKKYAVVLVAFLMMLYIGPVLFTSSSYHTAIPTEQNMSKEFTTSAYGDESPYSITSFSETLEDDVFFTPDGFYDETPFYAIDGNDDWADALHIDGSRWTIATDAEYQFYLGQYAIEGFEYSIYGFGTGGGGNISVYSTMDGMHILEEITSGVEQWYNGTYWGTNYEPEKVYLWSESNAGAITLDYIELRFHYLPLIDYSSSTNYTHYGESFTNVTDWTQESGTITTDTDKASIVGWTKRQNVSITGSSGAGTNYQVQLTVTYDSDMQTDFDDLRFTDNDEITELDYWIETYTASTSARVWVEVKDNLDSNQLIYMYYGNDAVSTTSDGDATFQEFYDKDDTTGWALDYGMTVTTSGDYLRFNDPVGVTSSGSAKRFDITTSTDFEFMAYYKTVSVSADDQCQIRIADASATDTFSSYYTPRSTAQDKWYYYDGALKEGGNWTEGTEFIFTVTVDEGDSTTGLDYQRFGTDWTLLDSKLSENFAGGSPTDADGLIIGTGSSTSEVDAYFKWIVFRKCIDTEPTVSSWGAEENTSYGTGRSYVSFSSTDYFEYYYEFYVTSTTNTYNFQFYYGTSWVNITDSASTTGTISGIISDSNASAITRFGFLVSGGTFVIDYLRISPATEMGWQHDGSTTAGVEAFNGGSISTDGDYISLVSDADGAIFNFTMDDTTTVSAISPIYYPFWEINIHPNDVGNDLLIRVQYADDVWNTVVARFTTIESSIRINMWAVSASSIKTFQLFGYSSQTTRVDYVKAYAIANYTVTQHASTPIDHYLYVNPAGVLYRVGSDANQYHITLAHDPAVSIAQATYNQWTMDTTGEASGRNDWALQLYNGTDWTTYYNETSGSVPTATVSDFALITYNAYSFSSITFVDAHQWHEVDERIIYFILPEWFLVGLIVVIFWSAISEIAINMFLIFGGLILIPVSVIYLVYGGRNNASMDKLFYGLIAFIFGWALFLGGIM